MKNILSSLILVCFINAALGQTQASFVSTLPALDQSPLDIAYFPDNYPMLKTQDKPTAALAARVLYSRPQKRERIIFGDLIEYGKVWRLGANETTEIEFFKDVVIGNKKLAKGRYSIYAIPNPDQWTIIINKVTDTWGAFVYDPKKDVLRVNVPVQAAPATIEAFTMHFDKTTSGANLIMAWDNVIVTLSVGIK